MGSHAPGGCPTGTGDRQAPLFGLCVDGVQSAAFTSIINQPEVQAMNLKVSGSF